MRGEKIFMAIFICGQIRATHRRKRDRTRVFSWRRSEKQRKVWRESNDGSCENCEVSKLESLKFDDVETKFVLNIEK